MLRDSQRNYQVNYNPIFVVLAVAIICFATVRNGNHQYTINIWLTVILADLIALFVAFNTKKIKLNIYNLVMIAVVFLITFAQKMVFSGYYSFGSAINGALLFAFFLLSIGIVVQQGYELIILKTINAFNMLGAITIIVQMLFKYVGVRLDKYGIVSEFLFNAWEFTDVFRPCGIFSEPSHFSEMMLISVFYYLYIEKKNSRLVILGLSLLFSTSSLGIIGFGFLVALRFIEFDRFLRLGIGLKILIIGIGCALIVMVLFMIQKSGNSNWLVDRMLSGSSFSVRVTRSFEIFKDMNWHQKLIGLGIQNQEKFLNYYYIVLPSDTYETATTNREFAQTTGYILCTMGIVGFCAFILPLVKLFMNKTKTVRCFIFLFIYITSFCCIFSRSIFFMYFVALYAVAGIDGGVKDASK